MVFIAFVNIGGQSPSLAEDKMKWFEAYPKADESFTKGYEAFKNGDFTTALTLFQPLAEKGDASVQSILGNMYHNGQGVPQDYKTAVKWYTLAAEQGIASAQFNLGHMYEKGDGVPQDKKIAAKWYSRAAEQGDARAQTLLGFFYGMGEGVPKNYIKAYMWLNIAVANGELVGVEVRDRLEYEMTRAQIEKAQGYSSQCVKQNYKNCDF